MNPDDSRKQLPALSHALDERRRSESPPGPVRLQSNQVRCAMRWNGSLSTILRGTHLLHPSYSEVGKEVIEFYVETQSTRRIAIPNPSTGAGASHGYPRTHL